MIYNRTIMLSTKHRFHGHGSLKYLYKNGTSVRSHWLTVKYIKNPHRKNTRVGVVISKKVHKSAVGRNRIRRRVYEIIRHELPHFGGVYDLTVIIVSGESITASHEDLQAVIKGLLEQTPVYDHGSMV